MRKIEIADTADLLPEGIDCSGGLGPQMSFELRKCHFDGVEVGAVGRQKQYPCASGANVLFRLGALVSGQIVHDHDIAGLEGGAQLGLDIGLEDASVHRCIDDEGCGQSVEPQACDEGLGLPMPVWRVGVQTLPLAAAPPLACHLGCCAGLIQEDQAMLVKPHSWLAAIDPFLACLSDVQTILFAGQKAFF